MRNLYVLIILSPRGRGIVLQRRVSRRPHAELAIGELLHIDGTQLRVRRIAHRVQKRTSLIENVTEIHTRLARETVVPMPCRDSSVVAEFLRYHVLVRVFDGDPDAWLATLLESGGDDGDLRFVRWIRSRLRRDPALIISIRRMVNATPFWGASNVM